MQALSHAPLFFFFFSVMSDLFWYVVVGSVRRGFAHHHQPVQQRPGGLVHVPRAGPAGLAPGRPLPAATETPWLWQQRGTAPLFNISRSHERL